MSVKEQVPYVSRIVDPQFNRANFRCEFRLPPDSCYYSDMRLINVGAFCASGATAYNAILGSECGIKAIRLMDGGVQLDALNEAPLYRAIQKVLTRNDGNISVGRYLSHNELGYIVAGQFDSTVATFGEDQDITVAQPPGNNCATTAAAAQMGWMSLKDVFPFLASSPVLPTNIFRELKVVVEFHSLTEMQAYITDATKTDAVTTNPVLLADELADGDMKTAAMARYAGARWLGVEHDRVRLPAVTGMAAATALTAVVNQSQSSKIRGFDGKYIHDMIVQMTPTTAPVSAPDVNKPFGSVGSKALRGAVLNVRVNGMNKLPGAGVAGHMRQLALASDTLGTLNVTHAQAALQPIFPENGHNARAALTHGELALMALDIEEAVEDLQISVSRDGVYNAGTDNDPINQAIDINVWGRVSKALVVAPGGSYTIVNATA